MPDIVVIGGPNGAGKSTFARYALPEAMPFLNADEIAKTLPEEFAGSREIESGRLLLARMEQLVSHQRSFAIETTLANRSLAPRLQRWQAEGWRVFLFFFFLPSPELSIARVASRVRRGGHDIPETTIRRRFDSGRQNLSERYLPLADQSYVLQNDDLCGPILLTSCGEVGNPASPLSDREEVLRRARLAVNEAVRDHLFAKNPIAIWRENRVVVGLPEEREGRFCVR